MKNAPALTEQQTRELIADYLANDPGDVIRILRLNGVDIAENAPREVITIAFLKAVTVSDQFRNEAVIGMQKHAHNRTKNYGFVDNGMYLNEDGCDPSQPWLGGCDSGTSTAVKPSTTSSSGGGFFSSLGKIFTPEVAQTAIKTGLNTYSTSLTAKANQASEQNALELERIRLQQIQAETDANKSSTGKGLSTGAWIGISIGGVLVLGALTWLIVKQVKKRRG